MQIDVAEALNLLCVDDLKALARQLPVPPLANRKAELVTAISCALLGPGLNALWERLDALSRSAVAEAAHEYRGEFLAQQFPAKYQRSPAFKESNKPAALGLFIYRHFAERSLGIPTDLRQRLLEFVPKPASAQIQTVAEPEPVPGLVQRQTELDAAQELALVLRMLETERVTLGGKTGVASTASQRLLLAKLPAGDFYPWVEPANKWEQHIGPIKAFAWPLLLQAGGLAKCVGTRLTLTSAGIKAMSVAPAQTLRLLWNKWLGNHLLDEFSRVEAIKGQKSAGRVMSAADDRRDAIEQALQDCPVSQWVALPEFSRFMQASGRDFVVTHDPWKLFIAERQYGSLGYEGSHTWGLLQHRYILALLFEYAATLGLIDVAYTDPTELEGGLEDFRDLWGADELTFLSRYDGLRFFRINALGAFVLGLSDTYQSPRPASAVGLRVLPSLSIGVSSGALDEQARQMFDTWAVQLPDDLWRLDRSKALVALEKGYDIQALQAFLQDHTTQDLPESVAAFVAECRANALAVKASGVATLLTCCDAATAARIAAHPKLSALCWCVEPKTLVVRTDRLAKFRAVLSQELGLGLVA
ncbi:MAG: hypothetical protein AUJ20_06370 [Comamonadaceae bacterium CG1_02_60_18]|nr:MAG: hypothetical protein AUJ20_06370 [Comamonadaceae bacterium CG1_02_60_18]PIQ50525.1 MAG: hypothetical protein COW02_19655 [Comamonadaceae bacterium CG12_big_fil_rev_8_21_14_0_65_59_15]